MRHAKRMRTVGRGAPAGMIKGRYINAGLERQLLCT